MKNTLKNTLIHFKFFNKYLINYVLIYFFYGRLVPTKKNDLKPRLQDILIVQYANVNRVHDFSTYNIVLDIWTVADSNQNHRFGVLDVIVSDTDCFGIGTCHHTLV